MFFTQKLTLFLKKNAKFEGFRKILGKNVSAQRCQKFILYRSVTYM